MSEAKLPAVRLSTVAPGQSTEDEGYDPDTVVVELPVSNKFGFTWPTEATSPVAPPPVIERPAATTLSSSEGETDVSDEEENVRKPSTRSGETDESEFVTPTNRMDTDQNPLDQVLPTSTLPRLSRALSMPLPSRLESLQNPRRISSSPGSPELPSVAELSDSGQFQELSLELADSVQMVIQILLQLSPPQVLDPAKEQFSSCSLSIPTPSVSAIFTSMKNLNYMSANMFTLGVDPATQQTAGISSEETKASSSSRSQTDFDVGEMLQNVGDALSGIAAQAAVDLVLFHGDVAMKHVAVRGDESGISYTLSHIIRQIINIAHSGDTVEIGLFFEAPNNASSPDPDKSSSTPSTSTRTTTPITGGPLRCLFHIAHKYSPSEISSSDEPADDAPPLSPSRPRIQPSLKTLILRRLLRHVNASLVTDATPRGVFAGRSYELSVSLENGLPAVVDPLVDLTPQDAASLGYPPEYRIAQEPTLAELNQFAESLRGRKVTLCASSKGAFAQHLTSYLTAWGLDVSPISPESDEATAETAAEDAEVPLQEDIPASATSEPPVQPRTPSVQPPPEGLSFVLIDDNVEELRQRLQQIHVEQGYSLNLQSRKRPSLAANHRPRSSPQVARILAMTPHVTQMQPSVVIVHFTALSNFKLVKDAIQTVLSAGGSSFRIPEIIVIPKPAGPRRFLTALHTAFTKPVVDPFFVPIATSPMSPGIHSLSPFFTSSGPARSPSARSTASTRTTSDRSARSPKDTVADSASLLTPGSPRGGTDGMEYFSDAAAKLGTSPSSGLVIQSPDGSPAGIFFHPKAKTSWNPASPAAEKEQRPPSSHTVGRKRGISFRRPPSEGEEGRLSRANSVAAHAETARRLARAPLSPDVSGDLEDAQDTPRSAMAKGKQRASSDDMMPLSVGPTQIGQSNSTEASSVASDPIPSSPIDPTAPRLVTRKTSPIETTQLPQAISPPISPQLRASGTASPGARRSLRRPAADSHASAPALLQKKGKTLTADVTIVPPISVLIVDDNPINQTILSTFMKKKRIKYDVAKNGEEAVEKWQTGGFHLILMDIQMPIMDGIEATKEIRRIEKTGGTFPPTPQSEGQRTPSEASTTESRSTTATPPYRSSVIIVALTASSLQSDRVAALAAGCNDFLTKPVSLHWLNNKIIEWGSIKALQMWADIRPDVAKSISTGQAAKAQSVARRLHVPEGRSTPPGLRSRSSSISQGRREEISIAEAAASLMRIERTILSTVPADNESPEASPPLSSNKGSESVQRSQHAPSAEADAAVPSMLSEPAVGKPSDIVSQDVITDTQPVDSTETDPAHEGPENPLSSSHEGITNALPGTDDAEVHDTLDRSSTREQRTPPPHSQ